MSAGSCRADKDDSGWHMTGFWSYESSVVSSGDCSWIAVSLISCRSCDDIGESV